MITSGWCPRLALLVVLAFAPPAQAATATTAFQVQITIVASCIIVSATPLNFGIQGVLAANVDATSTITVECTPLTTYNIGLDVGTGAGATVAARKMTGPLAATVTYSLFQDAARAALWGPTIGTNTVASTGTGAPQAFTVFGRVPPQATPGIGVYLDTITVTVTY